MIDQAEIHRMAQSDDAKERRWAVYQLRSNFADLPDKEQAWAYLHKLSRDRDRFVQERTADAIGSIFSYIPDKELAWADLHWLARKNSNLLCSAVFAIGLAFPYVPDKNQAWDELIWLATDKRKRRFVRWCIANALGSAFPYVSDKNQAWSDLIWIIRHTHIDARWEVVAALGSVFPQVPDKNKAWDDLVMLTRSNDDYERRGVALILSSAISHILDTEKAWSDLIHLIHDQDNIVRRGAADALGPAFPHFPDKNKAWLDLIILARYTDSIVRRSAADALGSAFAHLPDKNQAWLDLIRFTHDEDGNVRRSAADALGSAFAHLPDKNQTYACLFQLTHDKDSNVRRSAADALGLAFPHILDKEHTLETLKELTKDENSSVRASAEYSLGRASIFKATETQGKEDFRKELENALEFFEIAAKELTYSPACFCLPFYRSFYAIMFKNQEVEIEVQTYLIEAKCEVEGSESKEKLLEAIENLSNALKEVQKAKDFDEIKCDLNSYRRYCERTIELLDTTEDKAPSASRLIRKGLPIIDERIKGIIAEIQEKAKALCKQVKGTQLDDIGKEIFWQGQKLTLIGNPLVLDKKLNEMKNILSMLCGKLIENDTSEILENLNRIYDEPLIENKVEMMNNVMRTILEKVKNMTNNQIIIGNNNTQIQNLNSPQKKAPKKSKSPKKPTNTEPPATKEPKKSPFPYLSELESEISDIFKSVYQKDRKIGISEVNAKTLESLKHKLHDLNAIGNNIHWLDMGCGDGRCLEVLDDIQDRGNIYYHGIDISHKFLDDAQMRARKYGLKSNIETMNTAAMKFDSEFDLVSAVLFLHEVDPLCLPYVIRNMLRALKSDGTLVISDFEGPYEQEEGVVSWGAEYLKKFLSNIGGARMSIGFVPSGEFPKELGFYRCYVKKPELDEERFQKFIEGYGGFMKAKKEDSRKRREELRSQINKRVCEILKRPDIDTKNISDEEKGLLRESMGKEYGIKAQKIRLLTNEILFLDEKIDDFERGKRCGSN